MNKLLRYENIETNIKNIKDRGKLVLVGGCFDILHPGHLFFLKQAKNQGDTLIIMLEGDESITRRKGENRPANTLEKRVAALLKLDMVDYVLPLPLLTSDQEYFSLVKRLKPDIIAVTEGDPALSKKLEQAELVGGRVIQIEHLPEHSTTKLIGK